MRGGTGDSGRNGGVLRAVPKVVWLLAAGAFVNMVMAFTFVYLFVYLTGPRGLSTAAAGTIAGVGGIGLVSGNFTGGWFGDRFGHRRTLLAGSAVSGAGLVALPVLPTAALLLVLPVCQYAAGTVRAANSALVAVAVPAGMRRQGFAVMRFAANAGFTVGPPLGALVAAHWSYEWLFRADGLGTLLFAGYVARVVAVDRPGIRRAATGGGMWAALRQRPAVLVLLPAIVVVDTVYRQQYSTLPVFLADHGIGTGVYGALLAINGGVILLLELVVTVALRDRAPLRIVGTGLLLVGTGFAALAAGASTGTAVVMMLLVTAGEILYKTPATAFVADSAPPEFQGRFQSLYAGASTSGTVLAPPLGGALYQSAPGLLWPLCACLAALAGLAVFAAARLRSGLGSTEVARPASPADADRASRGEVLAAAEGERD
ncbi:MFS transporter [Kitasatospora cystarginea]|uniref:MFS transporter n=1 Tax=Kitasatospora cystarginea TaxID=58350 RepID=A0ABN3E531_9ACTN